MKIHIWEPGWGWGRWRFFLHGTLSFCPLELFWGLNQSREAYATNKKGFRSKDVLAFFLEPFQKLSVRKYGVQVFFTTGFSFKMDFHFKWKPCCKKVWDFFFEKKSSNIFFGELFENEKMNIFRSGFFYSILRGILLLEDTLLMLFDNIFLTNTTFEKNVQHLSRYGSSFGYMDL